MEDQKLKKLLEEGMESPSYGFAANTMRKIESEKKTKPSISIKEHNSVIRYLIPVLLFILLLTSVFLNDPQIMSFDVGLLNLEFSWPNFSIQQINIHFNWLIASIAVAMGFWIWILWEKRNLTYK